MAVRDFYSSGYKPVVPFWGEAEHTLEIGRFSLIHTSPGVNDKEGGDFSQRLPQLRDKSVCFTPSVD